jgi:methionine synthase II (cobalamin-independent)
LLEKAAEVIDPARLWVNPDCGLKTRRWSETEREIRRHGGVERIGSITSMAMLMASFART